MAKKTKSNGNGGSSAKSTAPDSKILHVRMHAKEVDILTRAAIDVGARATTYARDAIVDAACAAVGVENPGLPAFSPGRTSGVAVAARAAGMTPAEFRKQAIANAVKIQLG